MTKTVDSRTRALVRDLAGLAQLLEGIDTVQGLEQAIAERTNAINALTDQAEQAKKDTAAAIEQAKREASDAQAKLIATLNDLAAERDKLGAEVASVRYEHNVVKEAIERDEARLAETRQKLASIAANIGG